VPVSVGDIGTSARLVTQVVSFFANSARCSQSAETSSHRTLVRGIRERSTDQHSRVILDEWAAAQVLDDLPSIPQHGDFTVNNLGVSDKGLVVFDWEDYGKVGLPGFDVCMLIASDLRLQPNRLRALVRGEMQCPGYATLIAKACPLIGLTPELFLRLVPLYLVVFLDLKRDYGQSIRVAVKQLIDGLFDKTLSSASQ